MTILALDLSKSCTGFAILPDGADRPRLGHWRLGSEFTCDGQVFNCLIRNLSELRSVEPFEHLFYEQKINPANLAGFTNINTLNLLSGLEATIKTFSYAKRLRTCRAVGIEQWRPGFIGRIESGAAKTKARLLRKDGDKRASARKDLKALTMARCRQLGFNPRNDDESDALGILTHGLLLQGQTPAWLADEVLRQPLEVPA